MLARWCAVALFALACDATLAPISGSDEAISPGRPGGSGAGASAGSGGLGMAGAGGTGLVSGSAGAGSVVDQTGLEAYELNSSEIMFTARYTNELGEPIPLSSLSLRIYVNALGGTLAGRFDDAQFAEPYQDIRGTPRFTFDASTPPRYAEIGFAGSTLALAPGSTLIVRAGLFEPSYQDIALQAAGLGVYRDGVQVVQVYP